MKKPDKLLTIMFLLGSMIFLLPMLHQLKEVEDDEQQYAALLEQLCPSPDTTAAAPLAKHPDVAAEAPLQTVLPVLLEVPQSSARSSPESYLDNARKSLPPVSCTASPAVPANAGKPMSADLSACLEQNADFIAWITIPGTPINDPVVQSDRTSYYLKHLFNGQSSKLGCLFSLSSADYAAPSKNIAIYGHHLSHSNAMFSSLVKYKQPSYYAAHPTIEVQTLYGDRTYRIFAVVNMTVSDWDASAAQFSSTKEFQQYVAHLRSKALYDTVVPVAADDHILTLITCDRSYGGVSGRLLVVAVQE